MKRSTPLKRSPLVRKAPDKASLTIKPRKAKCKHCGAAFERFDVRKTWCSPECGAQLALKALDKARKAKAAKEKREDKAKLESIKRLSDLESECRVIVQEIARIRDRHDGCISCHMGPNYGGQWHGSHYRAHGNCSSLQLNLWNIHKACAQCNLHKHGNKEGFIQGLLNKPGYGRERLDWLDSQKPDKKFTRVYLTRFKAVMGKRRNRLRERARRSPHHQAPSRNSGARLGACIL